VPGELAPKLALGLAAESAGDAAGAASWYEIGSRTDPAYTTATLGLARCRLATGERAAALDAYERVPESSSSYVDAQIARINCLIGQDGSRGPALSELQAAGTALEALTLDAKQRAQITVRLLQAALRLLDDVGVAPQPNLRLAGCALAERDLRVGLERSYRELARLAGGGGERIRLVDWANQVRPRTWT
jgi:serine/threonine-protein kinase PknG